MKHLLNLVYLFTALLILSSCSSDDPAPQNDNAPAVGIYQLIEVNVSQQQDMIDEMSCLSGTLSLNADASWSLSLVNIEVTEITGGLLFLDCTEASRVYEK